MISPEDFENQEQPEGTTVYFLSEDRLREALRRAADTQDPEFIFIEVIANNFEALPLDSVTVDTSNITDPDFNEDRKELVESSILSWFEFLLLKQMGGTAVFTINEIEELSDDIYVLESSENPEPLCRVSTDPLGQKWTAVLNPLL